MDVTRSFKYVFEDKDWIKKVLIGGVLNLIPVVGQAFAMGFGLRQLKKMTEGQELPLPEWDDWGGDLKRGIMVLLGILAYLVPVIVLSIISAIFTGLGTAAVTRALESGRASGMGVWGICVGLITFIQVIYYIALAIWFPAALLHYVHNNEQFMAFFQFTDILAVIKSNTKDYITLVLMTVVAAVVASIVGGIACGVGALFTGFIATLVMMHLLGQFYNTVWGSGMPFSAAPQAPTAADDSFQIPQ